MDLFFREIGEGPEVVILHGLFGSSDNWQSFAKDLAASGYRVITADLRNHGRSPHDKEFNYEVMAADVAALIQKQCKAPVLVAGHSMGGKVTMQLSATHPELISGMIVIDIAPRYYPPHHQEIIRALSAVDLQTITTRDAADAAMQPGITNIGVRQFLMKNLYWKEQGKLDWRFNLEVIVANIENVGASTYPPHPNGLPALFIGGELSAYITAEDMSEIPEYFPNAKFVSIPGAGHWVHADQPKLLKAEFLKLLETV